MNDIIFGVHSIYHALKNPHRFQYEIFATDKGLSEFKQLYRDVDLKKVETLKPHDLQERAKNFLKSTPFEFSRVPSGIFLKTPSLEFKGNAFLYDLVEKNDEVKLLALDQVNDINNLGAILRTASFYNIDGVIISGKTKDGWPPGFFRVASGAYEHTPVIIVKSLSQSLRKIQDKSVLLAGLSEEASGEDFKLSPKTCLVLGSEQKGLSNAVERLLDQHISLKAVGKIESLNVSAACAIAIERFLHSEK